MDSTEKQLNEMLRELQSRSRAKIIFESLSFSIISLFLFVGNFITILVMLVNRRMRTIPNMFVASLAVSDFALGLLSADLLSLPVLVTSRWPFDELAANIKASLL